MTPVRLLGRYQSTAYIAQQSPKTFREIPSPPAWPLVGHLPLIMKEQLRMDKMFERLRETYGDILRVYVPGQGHMVALFKPEDIKMLYGNNEGVIPKIPGFDMLEFMRQTSKKDILQHY